MKFTIHALAMVAALNFSGQALAGGLDKCTDLDKSTWKPQADALAAAKTAGYEARKLKVNGTCYEVYGIGKDGALYELFYNPATLKLMEIVKKG